MGKRLRRFDEIGPIENFIKEITKGKILEFDCSYHNGSESVDVQYPNGEVMCHDLRSFLRKYKRHDLITMLDEVIEDPTLEQDEV